MLVIAWLVLSVAVCVYANRLKRDPTSWFWLSIFISPLLAGALLVAAGKKENEATNVNEPSIFESSAESEDDYDSEVSLKDENSETGFDRTSVDRKEKRITFDNCQDGMYFYSEYEYKFEANKVYWRLLERYNDCWGKTEYEVKDNVVLISAIKEAYDKSKFKLTKFEDRISELNSAIQWHEIVSHKLRFQLMQQHLETFQSAELKRMIRTEYERIKYGSSEVVKQLRALGVEVSLDGEYPRYQFPEELTDEQRNQLEVAFENLPAQFSITQGEMSNHIEILKDLDELLGDKKKPKAA